MDKKKGIGDYHLSLETEARHKIIEALLDGEWHRYQDLIKATGLSTATLTKHLKFLKSLFLEKRVDVKSGKYPYPVYYRLNSLARLQTKFVTPLAALLTKAETLDKEKEPRVYIHYLNLWLGMFVLFNVQNAKDKELSQLTLDALILWPFENALKYLMQQYREKARTGANLTQISKENLRQYMEDYGVMFREMEKKEPALRELRKEALKMWDESGVKP